MNCLLVVGRTGEAMDFDAEQAIARELGPGERLLWTGKPRGGLAWRSSDSYVVPFSLVWATIATQGARNAFRHDAPWFVLLVVSGFLVLGAYLVFGRFVVDALQRRHTQYGLTDKRAIIVSGVFRQNVNSVDLAIVTDLTLSIRADGSGTISFDPSTYVRWWSPGGWWPSAPTGAAPAFEMIERAREVHQRIRAAQEKLRDRGAQHL